MDKDELELELPELVDCELLDADRLELLADRLELDDELIDCDELEGDELLDELLDDTSSSCLASR